MATKRTKKAGGGKLTRSQTVTVRLDPKLRYLAELAGRKQRRTVSSFIEWAIQEALMSVYVRDPDAEYDEGLSFAQATEQLWDVDEADRFARLALLFPELLTHDEQCIWKVIRNHACFWLAPLPKDRKESWDMEKVFRFDQLRERWSDVKAVACGDKTASVLPSNPDQEPAPGGPPPRG